VFVEDAIHCATTEVDTLLLQPVDDLLPTTIVVFPSDGEYSPLDVRVDLTASWPLLGVLVVMNELSQAPQPDALSLQDPVGQPAINRGPVLPHPLGDDRHLDAGSMEFPC
jgi:hypothetical protein